MLGNEESGICGKEISLLAYVHKRTYLPTHEIRTGNWCIKTSPNV